MKMRSLLAGVLVFTGLAMGQKVKSKAEGEAVNAVISATTPDDRIAAADKAIGKFKDTEFKGLILQLAGEAYEQKGDAVNAIIYGNRSLEADPKNFDSMLLVARLTAQTARENDLNIADEAKTANKMATDAIAALGTAVKPNPQLPDDRWEAAKKERIAEAHNTLGAMAATQKKYDVAVTEFKTSFDIKADPVTMVRLADVYNKMGKFDDASATADKAISAPGVPPNVAKIAQEEKQTAEKGKAKK